MNVRFRRRPAPALLALLLAGAALLPGFSPGAATPAAAQSYDDFVTTAPVTPSTVARGETVTINVSVTSRIATTALVDVEVHGPGGKVFQVFNDGQSFTAGQTRTYPLGWTIADGVALGAYTVHVGVFSPGWGTVYHWNAGAGSLTISDGTPPDNVGAPKVMPLGDSLTDGYNIPGGYRPRLEGLLREDGLRVDFVGSLTNGPAGFRDQEHEGHSGWRIEQITGQAPAWLRAYQPEVVLLLIGTNDMAQNYDPGGAPGRLATLLDTITNTLPQTQVVVSSIPRMGPGPSDVLDRIQAYNAAIPGIVQEKAAAGRKIRYVDAFSVITPDDLAGDWTHMATGGNDKLAATFHPALRDILRASTPPATATALPVATATLTPTATRTATRTPTATATRTATSTATATATPEPPTATVVPPTATVAPPTATVAPPTATVAPPTATVVPPTATVVPPAATATPTATVVLVASATPTVTPTATPPATRTATATQTRTPTATAAAPSFTITAAASPTSVVRGGSSRLNVRVQSRTAGRWLVDVEIYGPNGLAFQRYYDDQAFTAGQTRSYTPTWSVPAGSPAGTYYVKVGVFSPGWTSLHAWADSAGQIEVTP
jgi:lysophospholipase L1-like esterase